MNRNLKERIKKLRDKRSERKDKAKVAFEQAGNLQQKIDVIAEHLGLKELEEEKEEED